MSLLAILLTLAAPAGAHALPEFSAADQARHAQAMAQFGALDRETEDLAPCRGVRKITETFRKFDPPASCPRTAAYVNKLSEHQRALNEACEELVLETSEWLRTNQGRCGQRDKMIKQGSDRYSAIAKKYEAETAKMPRGLKLKPEEIWPMENASPAPHGEFARWECMFPAGRGTFLNGAYTKILHQLNYYAEEAIGEICEDRSAAGEDFEAYVNEGTEAVDRLRAARDSRK